MITAQIFVLSLLGLEAFAAQLFPRNESLPEPGTLISQALAALGGEDNLSKISGVTYIGQNIFRTRTLMEAYSLGKADKMIASAGRQNVSFSYEGILKQRIDRFYSLDGQWIFGRPLLEPINYSLVVQAGSEGFAAVVEGSAELFAPHAPPGGNTDGRHDLAAGKVKFSSDAGLLAAYLIHEAYQISPRLLESINQRKDAVSRYEEIQLGIKLPAVHDSALNLTVIFNEETGLPYIIRSYEEHPIYGQSTSDFAIFNYTTVKNVRIPGRIQKIYNNEHILLDYVIDEVIINPEFEPGYFDGPGSIEDSNSPRIEEEYTFAEIGEWSWNNIWAGPYDGTIGNISATQPFDDIPGFWTIVVQDNPGYTQAVLDFEDAVVVFDAPPHQSHLVLQWVQRTLGKRVTHIWPSHHHHDHAFGLADYVAAGATVITVKEAQDYYKSIPGVDFLTYGSDSPLTLRDSRMQLNIVHIQGAIHAYDQQYAAVQPACVNSNSSTVVYQADYWGPGQGDAFDQALANELLRKLGKDRIANSTIVVPAHGVIAPLSDLIEATRFMYPAYSSGDFMFGLNDTLVLFIDSMNDYCIPLCPGTGNASLTQASQAYIVELHCSSQAYVFTFLNNVNGQAYPGFIGSGMQVWWRNSVLKVEEAHSRNKQVPTLIKYVNG